METATKAWSHVVGPLAEHPAVLAVVLFGSTATGTRRPFSDVDLCIIASRPLEREEKEDLFSNSAPGYDLSFFQDLPLYIQYRVFRDGKVLFCRDETQLQRLRGKTVSGYLDFSRILRRCCDRVLGECDVRP
ncbi:type VII toxin-antitoxin system MntA family adenylyltransferase antitoxin [Methanofollis ethanolicus]|uniref:type VII toxin-antitoxin system MntA family adenylyltransferase antitoxin n=1 Tax=Methanofollis ethanolicus TaxID=488124 RepID=UPI0013666222|nr:nucleotidyltransferase domain-containing protein [Methanofollis ethanolicus]